MTKELISDLHVNSLIGFTEKRGNAWWYRAEDDMEESNHYPMAIPMADVKRRLFNWEAASRRVAVEVPADLDTMTHVSDSGEPMMWRVEADRQAITRDDTEATMFIPSDGYQIHQYAETLLGGVSNIIGDQLQIGSAGLLQSGAVAYVQVEVPESIETPEGVAFRPNLLATTSHNGTCQTTYKRTVTIVVCHERGTVVRDGDWVGKVEDHPSFIRSYIRPGIEVQIKGLPFPEKVTYEHRYWIRERTRKNSTDRRKAQLNSRGGSIGQNTEPSWVEAKSIKPLIHEIGTPIDMTECSDPRISDSETAWMVGYLWGNGNIGNRSNIDGMAQSVQFSIPDEYFEYGDRIMRFAKSKGWDGSLHRAGADACQQLSLTHHELAEVLDDFKISNDYGMKSAPLWVQTLPLEIQREIVKGYHAADGDKKTDTGLIINSVSLQGLLSLRTILSRLGVPSSIRKGSDKNLRSVIMGRKVNAQDSYSIRASVNVDQFGIETRHKSAQKMVYIEDGYLWAYVDEALPCGEIDACPIVTESHQYLTAYGLSHNCDNTREMALGEEGQVFKTKHTKNSVLHIKDAREALMLVEVMADDFSREIKTLCETDVSDAQFSKFLDTYTPLEKAGVPLKGRGLTLATTKREDLTKLWKTDERVSPWKNTAWGVLQMTNTYNLHSTRVNAGNTRVEKNMLLTISGKTAQTDVAALDMLQLVLSN